MRNAPWILSCLLLGGALLLVGCGKPDGPNDNQGTVQQVPRPKVIRDYTIQSTSMKRPMRVSIWFPPGYDSNKSYPFLYLLHGYGDDQVSWLDKGQASRYATTAFDRDKIPMIIIMPDALTTFYIGDFEKYFHNELMPDVEKKYNCNGKRAVAGLSMGGYGTLYYALKYPDKFLCAYAMSPATDVNGFEAIIKEKPEGTVFPDIIVDSGTQDYTVSITSVRDCVDMLNRNGVKNTFVERDGGHTWDFWQYSFQEALRQAAKFFK